MWLVFCFFIFIVLGIIFSKIRITFKSAVLNSNKQDFNIEFKVLAFGFIKVCTVKFEKRWF
jgi:hypothetical protein